MIFQTGSDDLDRRLDTQLAHLAERNAPSGYLANQVTRIREAVFHDFSSYRFLLPPAYLRHRGAGPAGATELDGSDVSVATWMAFDTFVSRFDTDVQAVVADWVWHEVGSVITRESFDYMGEVEWWREDHEREQRNRQVFQEAREGFSLGLAPDLFAIYTMTPRPAAFLMAAQTLVSDWLVAALRALRRPDGTYRYTDIRRVNTAPFWQAAQPDILPALADFLPSEDDADPDAGEEEFGEALPETFAFEPFMPATVNFGLQTVYRQGWTPLGTQPGEIVRTLPLGPKQTEKISVKAVRRTKATRQAEISSSIETATESSAATKDSSEVVQEASESFNWHVEATASASFGFGSASVTAGAGGENASSSRDTKSQLNETMEKTASKIRKDTKIIVSTEVEETSEFSQISEISNPNDEIAVTYIYSRLQRQYEIRTYLSEVNQVIYVAEAIPSPSEITGPWVRRYDWIISRALLDESFRSDLDAVRRYEDEGDSEAGVDPRIAALMGSLSGDGSTPGPGVPDYSGLPGQIPDIHRQQQEAYEREVERERARAADRAQYRRSVRRLRGHIYDNILHYCRAIWSSEDPDQRALRYARTRVPIRWEFVATGSGPQSVEGYFAPAVTDRSRDTAPLSDLVNPAGPIGFAGNYAVFYLRHSTRWASITRMLQMMQAPYLRFDIEIARAGLDPAVGLRAAVSDSLTGPAQYRFTVSAGDDGGRVLNVQGLDEDGVWTDVRVLPLRENRALVFLGLKLIATNVAAFNLGDQFEILLRSRQMLEDPELKAIKWSEPPLDDAGAAAFFTLEAIAEARENFADVYRALKDMAVDVAWADLDETQRAVLRARYFELLLRRQHTRRIVLDTNNLMLTREVDDATTLEPFKGLHRVIDVLSANAAVRAETLEADRLSDRLDAGHLGDPDIDKLTVVAADPGFAGLAALDGLTPDGPDGPTGPVAPDPLDDD
ncbi:MAG: hypothetical protein HWE33_14965 [Rhodobacteraceae bacterium]|nr:hypothetical protein [Paracoccaceae bacterium]